jgi:hypothetical protein
METKSRISEAERILQSAYIMERVQSEVYSVVQAAVALGVNIAYIRSVTRKQARPFRAPMSGRTKRGHRGFSYWDLVRLVLGRKAMAEGVSGRQTQHMIDTLAEALKPCIEKRQRAGILLSESKMTVLSDEDASNRTIAEELLDEIEAKSERSVLLQLDLELADLGERLAAMLEHREYQMPEIVRLDRARRLESLKRALSKHRRPTISA